MSHHVQKIECACESCGATGLYVGYAERNGAAVVCHTCDGTGKVTRKIEWDEFDGRKTRRGIKRVFGVNPGIGIGENKEMGLKLKDFGGMSYAEWRAGKKWKPGMEDRKHTCPAWFYQSFNYDLKPDWKECSCCGSFSDCESFADKGACWKRWDKEFAPKFKV